MSENTVTENTHNHTEDTSPETSKEEYTEAPVSPASEVQPDIKPDIQAELESEPQPEPQLKLQPEPQPEPQIKSQSESQSEPAPAASPAPDILDPQPTQKKPLFRFRSKNSPSFSRDEWILSNISSNDLMDYLRLEQTRLELLQKAKDIRERRILKAFELTVSLGAATAITYLLKDEPTILISILYIIGIVSVFWLWKKSNDKNTAD